MNFLKAPIKRGIYIKVILAYVVTFLFFIVILAGVPSEIWRAVPYLFDAVFFLYIVVFGGFTLITSFYLIMRRLQTLGHSPLWMILMFFPLIFTLVVIYLMFPGDDKIVLNLAGNSLNKTSA